MSEQVSDTYKSRILAIRGAGRWRHCVDVETAASIAAEADAVIEQLRDALYAANQKEPTK